VSATVWYGAKPRPAKQRYLPVVNGWFLGVHRIAGQGSFVYFAYASVAVIQKIQNIYHRWPNLLRT
jgi:hypothetical protein